MTPMTPPRSTGRVKAEDHYAASTSSFYIPPEKFGAPLHYSQISNMQEESLSTFSNMPMDFCRDLQASSDNSFSMYSTLADYSGPLSATTSIRGIASGVPSLDMNSYSPSTAPSSQDLSDYVDPSQTTFLDTQTYQSPIQSLNSMHLDLSFESPASSHFTTDFYANPSPTRTMADSLTYLMPHNADYRSASTTPQKPRLRQPISSGLPSTLALRQVTNLPCVKHEQRVSNPMMVRRNIKRETQVDIQSLIKIEEQSKFPCLWDDKCGRRFKRKEHLKRHERTHLGFDDFQCIFCEKSFNRNDNLKQHVVLHTQPKKKAGRTKYFPDAIFELQRLSIKKRKMEGRTSRFSSFEESSFED